MHPARAPRAFYTPLTGSSRVTAPARPTVSVQTRNRIACWETKCRIHRRPRKQNVTDKNVGPRARGRGAVTSLVKLFTVAFVVLLAATADARLLQVQVSVIAFRNSPAGVNIARRLQSRIRFTDVNFQFNLGNWFLVEYFTSGLNVNDRLHRRVHARHR